MKFWICYEVNNSDEAATTEFTDCWDQAFEYFTSLDEAVGVRQELLRDNKLYRSISPILIAHPDRTWEK